MGPCGTDVLYDRYLGEGEFYHCQMASALWEFAQTQEEELCTWGFGELAPLV